MKNLTYNAPATAKVSGWQISSRPRQRGVAAFRGGLNRVPANIQTLPKTPF